MLVAVGLNIVSTPLHTEHTTVYDFSLIYLVKYVTSKQLGPSVRSTINLIHDV